jgi:hypothetical protein
MLGAAAGQPGNAQAAAAERALAEAETTLRRLQAAIEASADPAALVDPLNRAQERVMAAASNVTERRRLAPWAVPRSRRCWTTSVTWVRR